MPFFDFEKLIRLLYIYFFVQSPSSTPFRYSFVFCPIHLSDDILTKLAWFRKRIWKAVFGKVVHLSSREFVISHQQAKPPFIQDGSIRGSDYKTCRYVTFFYFVGMLLKWKTILYSTSIYLSCSETFSFNLLCLSYSHIFHTNVCVFVCVLSHRHTRTSGEKNCTHDALYVTADIFHVSPAVNCIERHSPELL